MTHSTSLQQTLPEGLHTRGRRCHVGAVWCGPPQGQIKSRNAHSVYSWSFCERSIHWSQNASRSSAWPLQTSRLSKSWPWDRLAVTCTSEVIGGKCKASIYLSLVVLSEESPSEEATWEDSWPTFAVKKRFRWNRCSGFWSLSPNGAIPLFERTTLALLSMELNGSSP